MAYIDVRLWFEETDDYGYPYYKYEAAEFIGSSISHEDREGIAESLAQSDEYWIGTSQDILDEISET